MTNEILDEENPYQSIEAPIVPLITPEESKS